MHPPEIYLILFVKNLFDWSFSWNGNEISKQIVVHLGVYYTTWK